jgi:hypothetical protein
MVQASRVGISASKVIALISTLILIRDSIGYFYTRDALTIIFGIVGLILAFIVFDSLKIIDFQKIVIPFIWWVLLIIGLFLILMEYLVGPNFLAGILMLVGSLIEFLSQKKPYPASRIVSLIGGGYTIFEAVSSMIGGNSTAIAIGIVAIIFAIVLILTLTKIDIKIPYTWWVVLIIGFVVFTWFYLVSGTIIMVAFILILMAY